MKKFEFTGKNGVEFVVGVNEDPQLNKSTDEYYLEIEYLSVNGKEIQRDKYGYLHSVEFTHAKGHFVIEVKYWALKKFREIIDVDKKHKAVYILCNDDLIDYYENVFKLKAEETKKQREEEKARGIQKAFDTLTDETILKVDYHSSFGYTVKGETGEHEWFKKAFSSIGRAKKDLPGKYCVDSYWGDYTIQRFYEIPFGEIKKAYNEARKILAPKEEKAAREKAERETKEAVLKAAVKCEVIKEGRHRGEELDPYAIVRMTSTETGEVLEFNCRNVFDVGYVINPTYSVAKGLEPGGLCIENKWQTFESGKGWYDVRELTEFEKLCIEYLYTFPPVSTSVRL